MSGLIVNRLNVSHGAIHALHDISFSVDPGQLAAVIGSMVRARPLCYAHFLA